MRSPARRYGDAFAELLTGILDAGGLPTEGGERPHLTVTVALDTLRSGLEQTLAPGRPGGPGGETSGPRGSLAGELDLGGALSGRGRPPAGLRRPHPPRGARRRRGAPGRGPAAYIVPTGLRRALIARDRGCAFPGCDRPPHWCHAHHNQH